MIGLLASQKAEDPDGQHGANLKRWLSCQGHGSTELLFFDALRDAGLDRYSGLWWHHTAGPNLPEEGSVPSTVTRLRTYVERGGKLFLSRMAARYVEILGLDPAPDTFQDTPPRFFLRPGLHVEAPDHPLLQGLRRVTQTYGRIEMASFSDLAWVNQKPSKGLRLAAGERNGAVLREEGILWEWRLGRGRVIAFSGVALHFYSHEDRYKPNLLKLVEKIIAYLEQPCLLEFQAEAGTLPRAFFGDRYEAASLGRARLAFDRTERCGIRIELAPFQLIDPRVRLCLLQGNRILLASSPKLVAREGGTLTGTLSFDASKLEGGYFELSASIKDGKKTVKEQSAPLLIRGRETPAFRQYRTLTILSNGRAGLEIDQRSGMAKGLYARDHPFRLNFLANETNSILDEGDPAPWFGTVMGRGRTRGEHDWRAFSNRSSKALPGRADKSMVRFRTEVPGFPMRMEWAFQNLPDRIRWAFTLSNEGREEIEIGSLYFPVSLNTHFGLDGLQERTYRRRVMMHNLICGRSSYLFAEPLAGCPPFLLILPRFDEGLEMMWHDRGRFAGRQPAWEGLLYAGIFTRAEQEALACGSWYNGHTGTCLAPSERRTFAFDLLFIDSYDAVNETLVREGFVALWPHPGMVVPVDLPAACRIQSLHPFRVEGKGGLIWKETARDEKGARYDLLFENPGAYSLEVQTDAGVSRYHFKAIPPLEALIKARGAFIAKHQQYRNPASARDHALLMWDAEAQALVVRPKQAFLAGGSDEPCFADPVFLSAKQIFHPEPGEIEVLERYIEHFLFGKVQSREDFGVRRWVAEPGVIDEETEGHDTGAWTDRSFNYPHVFNIYYALYETGRRYGLLKTRRPLEYLEMAARTAHAYLEGPHCLNAAIEQGNPGDRALELIVNALEAEGLEALHVEVRRALEPKIRHLKKTPYPYASEYAFDTTGYEGVYWIRRMAGDAAGVDTVLSTLLGTRGKQPFWYHFGGDVRWGWGNSKFLAPDEICFNYMCGLNGRVLIDAWRNVRPDPMFLSLGFAACIAPFALVDPDGTAHDFCGWEPGRVRFDPWSSEMGLGIMPSLFALFSLVLFEPDGEMRFHGCMGERSGGTLRILPRDGIRRRLVLRETGGKGFSIHVDRSAIREACYRSKSARIELTLEKVAEGTDRCRIRIEPLAEEGGTGPIRVHDISLEAPSTRVVLPLDGPLPGVRTP